MIPRRLTLGVVLDDLTYVCCWIVLFLVAAVILLVALHQPAPSERHDLEGLFLSPKIGLRAAALACPAPGAQR